MSKLIQVIQLICIVNHLCDKLLKVNGWFRNNFLNVAPKVQAKIVKIYKLHYIKIKNCASRNKTHKLHKQPKRW